MTAAEFEQYIAAEKSLAKPQPARQRIAGRSSRHFALTRRRVHFAKAGVVFTANAAPKYAPNNEAGAIFGLVAPTTLPDYHALVGQLSWSDTAEPSPGAAHFTAAGFQDPATAPALVIVEPAVDVLAVRVAELSDAASLH